MTDQTYVVYGVKFGKNPAGVDETPMILYNSKYGLYSYQFPDNHIIGSNTPPDKFSLPGGLVVGVPARTD